MTSYQLYMRVKHFFVACYYRGHGIHSPSLYQVVRQVFMKYPADKLALGLQVFFPDSLVDVVSDVQGLDSQADIILLLNPFNSWKEKKGWEKWRAENSCRSVWLKSALVIFRDPQFPNQHFDIRT